MLVVNLRVRELRAVVAKVVYVDVTLELWETEVVTSITSQLSSTLGSKPVRGVVVAKQPRSSFRGITAVVLLSGSVVGEVAVDRNMEG